MRFYKLKVRHSTSKKILTRFIVVVCKGIRNISEVRLYFYNTMVQLQI